MALGPSMAQAQSNEALEEEAKEQFKSAMDAIDGRDWQSAIAALERAVKILPKENGELLVTRYGRLTRNFYLPHYYLGLSHFRNGDCDASINAFARSTGDREIVRHRQLLKEMEEARRECAGRGGGGGGGRIGGRLAERRSSASAWIGVAP